MTQESVVALIANVLETLIIHCLHLLSSLHFWLLHLLQMDLSPSASEASKLLEAALEQMDGIIQGAKFEIPAKAANNPVSEALRNLHTCLLREDASASTLASVEPESIEFVFNWLRNNLMFDPGE